MRILIDLQACQSTGSRHRGIGRYSLALAQAMASNAGNHEVHLLLNSLFADSLEPVRLAFEQLVAPQHIHYWKSPGPVSELDHRNRWRTRAGELVREQALAEWRPDIVHVSSLFEGLTDDALTSVGLNGEYQPTAVTLYDLIPLINAKPYLENAQVKAWYLRKIQALKRADLLLAISASSRREGLECLHLPPERIVNISSAVDDRFYVQDPDPVVLQGIKNRFGLQRPYVMYTGGIDLRKNVEALIRSFAKLPSEVRKNYQLAIVCSVQDADRVRLQKLAADAGLASNDVILTGYVADEDLPLLYHACTLFVFPSWHEGFGLPALEAMSCGAPVIASNTSSLPEVIGREDALFNPYDEQAITGKMLSALKDENYLQSLREHGVQQARKFSWDASAKTAITAFEAQHEYQRSRQAVFVSQLQDQIKPRLAYFSPLPPERSGIADFSAELLPELAVYYDIELIVDQQEIGDLWLAANFPVRSWQWFEQHADRYQRVLYNLGNSTYHTYMLDMLARHPGIVVLHDFFLSGLLAHLDMTAERPQVWAQALYESHGLQALLETKNTEDLSQIIWKYPCNYQMLDAAQAVIVHSEFSMKLARQWYGEQATENWTRVPHMRKLPYQSERQSARASLGLGEDDFLMCSFGLMGPTKLNHLVLEAWLQSPMAKDRRCHLVFVGKNDGGKYGMQLLQDIKERGFADRIIITGFADPELFQTYLHAADAGVQLRGLSRGESSYTVLDCMAYGIPTIINSNGAMAELPGDALIKLDDEVDLTSLLEKMVELRTTPALRKELGSKAIAYMHQYHVPHKVGRQYFDFVELAYRNAPASRFERTLNSIAKLEGPATEADLISLASNLVANQARPACARALFDIQALQAALPEPVLQAVLAQMIASTPRFWRCELVRPEHALLRYANGLACQMLELPALSNPDEAIDLRSTDVFVKVRSLTDKRELIKEQSGTQIAQLMGEMGVSILEISVEAAPGSGEIEKLASGWWQKILQH
ncbi:glycosyltransferase [Undibacterium sp. Di27W]|uniref:glycosyltransferase n=1 Tax=Undibacterium sp. Di27W TaxID=3413036 RepID=UPI003BF119ED